MIRGCHIRILAVVAGVCLAPLASGCGYRDHNAQAARVVARAYIVAYSAREPSVVCRVVIPSLAASFAAESGGSCEKHVLSTFKRIEPAVRLGEVRSSGGVATVYVAGDRSRFVRLLKFGSLWRVVESWKLS
jgi:hypothetical protein